MLNKLIPINLVMPQFNHITDIRRRYHEMAHYQIAHEERKHLPHYGLGAPPDEEDTPRLVPDHIAFEEEELAATLGVIYEIYNKIDPTISYEDHASAFYSESNIRRNVTRLKKLGLIYENN